MDDATGRTPSSQMSAEAPGASTRDIIGPKSGGEQPPMPRLALTVGVIGHRPDRLPEDKAKLTIVENAVAAVLEKIYLALRIAHDKYVQRDDRPGGGYTVDRPLI